MLTKSKYLDNKNEIADKVLPRLLPHQPAQRPNFKKCLKVEENVASNRKTLKNRIKYIKEWTGIWHDFMKKK